MCVGSGAVDGSVGWFLVMASLSVLGWVAGVRLGCGEPWQGRLALAIAALLLAAWTWLVLNPAVAVRVIPLTVLSQIEGTGSTPMFMMIVGVGWARSRIPRQRHIVAWATAFGVLYFLHGSAWMLQATPRVGLADTPAIGPVMQSQTYSCVPAACATALNTLGYSVTEAEMAVLTRTRPGTGSTTLRALDGLSQFLQTKPYRAELLELEPEDLRSLATPAVVPLQYEPTRRHMVTVSRVIDAGWRVEDPLEGPVFLPWDQVRRLYCGQVIVFDRR